MGRYLSQQCEPSTQRKRGDSIHKEQLWKSEVYFTQISLWWDLPTWWKCKRLYMEIRGVTSVLTGSVCMVSGPAWAFRDLLDLAVCQPDALCPCTALLSPVKRKLPGLFNRMKTYVGITWSCMLLRPTVAAYMWPNVLDQVRDLAPRICRVGELGFKARFEPVSMGHRG